MRGMDKISELPQEILQRILYFLSQDEAVRTSVLSKSWHRIWCTRSNLEFSDTVFKGDKQDFLSTVDNTLQRYRDQRLCLEEFHLRMSLDYLDRESVSFLEKLIPTLANIGVKEFRLVIYSKNGSRRRRRVKLPSLVFEAESLQVLHVKRLTLDPKSIERRTVLPKHLKKLHLEEVNIDDGILQKIISSCPLIESMILKSCRRLRKVQVNNLLHLKNLYFSSKSSSEDEDCSIDIYAPSIENIHIDSGIILFQKGADFLNLSSLYMGHVRLSLGHFCSCKFPSLENLALICSDGLEESIDESELLIDAPNIKTFGYLHDLRIPISIYFATTSREWSSTLLVYFKGAPSSWLLKLHKLLKSLSRSEISLNIYQYHMNDVDKFQENLDLVQDLKGGNKPAVVVLEKLTLQHDLSYFSPLSNLLFCICRPRSIGDIDYVDSESVLKNLMQRESGNQDQLRQLWLPDLEEVSLEMYDKNRREWHPTSLSDLPDYEEGKHISTRFALKWRETL